MKSALIAAMILALLFIGVGVNTAIVDNLIDETASAVDSLGFDEQSLASFDKLSEKYERYARYISLTVSHVMISEIEEAFAEMEGAIKSEDEAGFIQAKSRLIDALGLLRRLAGVSFYSII